VAATRQTELTLEEYLKNAENGVLDDRVDVFMTPDMYGPSARPKHAASRPNGTVSAGTRNGKAGHETLAPTPRNGEPSATTDATPRRSAQADNATVAG